MTQLFVLMAALTALQPPPNEEPPPPPPEGRIFEAQAFRRAGGVMGTATVYLPPQYLSEPDRRFPVLVLLHGLGGAASDYITKAYVYQILDDAIAAGRIEPLVAVIPDGGSGYWVDWPAGKVEHRFASLVEPDLREWTDKVWRTDGRRAIAGLSMGGFGALSIALRHPKRYLKPPSGRGIYLAAFGAPGAQQYRFAFWNPLDLIRLGLGKGLPIWLDCGRDDRAKFTRGLKEVSIALKREGVDHVARFRPGRHEWPVWNGGLTDSLGWLAQQWAKPAPQASPSR